MTNDRICPECRCPLPPDAREEVCPTCALQGLLKFVTTEPKREPPSSATNSSSSSNPEAITRFGDYELPELLARGGMGVVYKARQISLNRTVALKMIQAGALATPAEVKRFHAEAEAIAQLHHPNIVAVYEIGEHEGQHYFSMDYVAGRTLAEIVHDGPLPAIRAATYVKTVAVAVQYAHQQGILHRDLKPANIIIDENDQPRITDFGLAKRFQDSALRIPHSALTLSGQVLGSPNYLPPEQAEPKRGMLGPPSDVYALGAILYHLITGRPPFQAESLTTLLQQVIESDPLAPRSLNPGIPCDLETICVKCLEKEPQRRYDTAQALADDLDRFLNREPVQARPIGSADRAWRWCRRRPVLASLVTALVLVLILGMGGISWQWRRAERERDMALRQAYAADMKVAQFLLEEGNIGGVRQILAKHRPSESSGSTFFTRSQADLRGWEWRYLWGQCQSDERTKLVEQKEGFANLALSPDGRLLALRQWNGDIELWNWGARSRLGTLTNRGGEFAFSFSPDGKILASANVDSAGKPVVSLWEVATQRVVRELPQPFEVSSLAFTPTGELLTTFSYKPQVSLWEVPSGRLARSFVAKESLNWDMRFALFSADGRTLVLADCGPILVIDLRTGASREIVATSEGNAAVALALSPDGQLLASGHGWSDASIRLWNVHTGKPAGSLEGHRGWVGKLVFSQDGRVLYSASKDQSIRAWNVQQLREIAQWRGHTDGLSGLALSPDGRTLLSCALDGSVRLWDPQGPRHRPAYIALPIAVAPFGAPFTRDSRRLITASLTNLVTIWDVASATPIEQIPALGSNNYSVALSPDERWVAVGGFDGSLRVWDRVDRRLVKEGQPHRFPVFRMGFLDNGRTLVSGALLLAKATEVKRWEVGTWRETGFGPIDLDLTAGLAQSPDQRHFALTYFAKPPRVWECTSGRLQMVLCPASGLGWGGVTPTFSPDGRLLAAALEPRICVWDLASQRQIAVLEQPGRGLVSVCFSPDGKRLATGSREGGDLLAAVEVWDYFTQRGLLSLRSRGKFTGWTEFSPDGNTLLALSYHGLAELWHAPSWAEIEEAERTEGKRARETVRP